MKDCPFCGSGGAEIRTTSGTIYGPGGVWVQCVCCGASGGIPDKYFWNNETDPLKQQEAIDKWNMRI